MNNIPDTKEELNDMLDKALATIEKENVEFMTYMSVGIEVLKLRPGYLEYLHNLKKLPYIPPTIINLRA